MILRTIFATLVVATSLGAIASPVNLNPRDDGLAGRIDKQTEISFQGVLNNLGPKGSKVPPGTAPGAFIAAPSRDPDYFFTWTRDSALTVKMIIDLIYHGRGELRPIMQDYLKSQAILQTVSNPSGALASGNGLGEPKYYANLTRFDGSWGRPQRDGPALRATALLTYARLLLDTGDQTGASEVKDKVWPVIQNDLNYVAQYWNYTGFDLWEETQGSSFFTTAVQHRALVEGAALGRQLGIDVAAYESQAPNILCFLQTYWDQNGQYAIANINTDKNFKREGHDAATVLASIATFDPEAKCDDTTFQPCSDRALANLKSYVDAFRTIYPINKDTPAGAPIATGRYPEDVYYGGQPWYLTTLAVAEQLYDAVQQWSTIESITVTEATLPFWKQFFPTVETGTFNHFDGRYYKLLDAVVKYADGFVEVALKYTPEDGSLSEQFSRENGTQVSARDLTWSYASFVTMREARYAAISQYPQVPSWGGKDANKPPPVCKADSVPGVYKPAVGAGAPPGAGGCTIMVTFNVNATTYFGEDILLTGNTPELRNWNLQDPLVGDASGYTQARPLWRFELELPAASDIQYRYVRRGSDGKFTDETETRNLRVANCANVIGPGRSTIENAWDKISDIPQGKL